MRIEVIYCPDCPHKLRIPEDLLGTEVQCPECKIQFVAPPPPPGAPGEQPREREPVEPVERDDDQYYPDRTGRWLKACGIGLVVVSLLSVLASLLRFFIALSPEMFK